MKESHSKKSKKRKKDKSTSNEISEIEKLKDTLKSKANQIQEYLNTSYEVNKKLTQINIYYTII